MGRTKLIETPEKLMEIFEEYRAYTLAILDINGCYHKRLQRW
jgi:hypothetical protein